VLQIEPLGSMVGANLAQVLNVPFTYCWSPALIPKPYDWPSHIGRHENPNMLSNMLMS
jgi:sterol 3beta-glucosyltransferase